MIGIVEEKKLLGNGLFKIVLEKDHSRSTVRGLSPERHPFLSKNCETIMLCNLSKDIAPGCYKENILTTGYRLS